MSLDDAIERFRTDKDALNKWVGVYIGVLAVLLAICNVGGANAAKDATRANIEASNTWAFFQAKNIRRNSINLAADELELLLAAQPGCLRRRAKAVEAKIKSLSRPVGAVDQGPGERRWAGPALREGQGAGGRARRGAPKGPLLRLEPSSSANRHGLPAKRGGGETKEAHRATLFDVTGLDLAAVGDALPGKVVAELRLDVVNKEIIRLLGYGANQFRQIVLLPQGRFETFLAANTQDRVEILRELFDVSLYRRLGRAGEGQRRRGRSQGQDGA